MIQGLFDSSSLYVYTSCYKNYRTPCITLPELIFTDLNKIMLSTYISLIFILKTNFGENYLWKIISLKYGWNEMSHNVTPFILFCGFFTYKNWCMLRLNDFKEKFYGPYVLKSIWKCPRRIYVKIKKKIYFDLAMKSQKYYVHLHYVEFLSM